MEHFQPFLAPLPRMLKKQIVIVAFGLERYGTEGAVQALIDALVTKKCEEKFRNTGDSNYLAKVIIKKDDHPPYDFSKFEISSRNWEYQKGADKDINNERNKNINKLERSGNI